MRKKITVLAVLVLAGALAVGIAQAQYGGVGQHKIVSKASKNKPGTNKKPAQFLADWRYDLVTPAGIRGATPITWSWKWKKAKIDGTGFPVCTADMIDEAQSDSVCPKGSKIATTTFAALLGPEGDPTTSVGCTGKSTNVYNGGPKKQVWIIVGPAEGCAGVAYIPPFEIALRTKKGTTTSVLVFPDNVTHPLPGIEGGLTFEDYKQVGKAQKIKKNGKKKFYMTSAGCTGKRTFTFTITDTEGSHTETTNAGNCT